ncbi:hypothetical protein BS47DRAFT_1481188 [Hydnum rufescens UP504]|uniref:DUF6534 domain-containing protein n=1 Tax=Hydnum rufescens UP504 TaxID=1448309 RepID=A0A9P6E2D5_9AGAM|nr:hypothetical protein BS47DRAFT_1481188 [Hydnum rufescens UP504]
MSREVNLTLGPMETGHACNLFLMGVLVVQTYQYYSTFKDPSLIQILVAFVLLIDILQTSLMTYMVWTYTVTHFGDLVFLSKSVWMLSTIPFYSVPISWVVQGFFAWRIRMLTKRRIFSVIILILASIQGLAGIGAGIGSFFINTTAENVRLQPIAIIWFVFAISCDSLITAMMVWTLTRAKTGFSETDTLITKINRGVIETGLSCTINVIVDAILLFRVGGTDMHLIPVMMVGKVYSNSFLFLLNSRARYRKALGPTDRTGFDHSLDYVGTLKFASGDRSEDTMGLSEVVVAPRDGGQESRADGESTNSLPWKCHRKTSLECQKL